MFNEADTNFIFTGEEPSRPALINEVFVSRNVEWWSGRSRSKSKKKMRIKNGMLLFQSPKEECFPLIREDVLIEWKKGRKFPTNLLRLLPMWICIRIVVLDEDSK